MKSKLSVVARPLIASLRSAPVRFPCERSRPGQRRPKHTNHNSQRGAYRIPARDRAGGVVKKPAVRPLPAPAAPNPRKKT